MVDPASGAFSLTCVSLAVVDRYILVRTQYCAKITLNQARLAIILAAIFCLFVYSVIPITVLSVLCCLIWNTVGQLPAIYLHGGIR
ncbi:unnamed protein product [Rotaria socialis]|nr:unnamed protein product [Rotaria socialis]